jgi:hypothetical protein
MPLTDYADLLAYLLAKPGTSHDTPYGPGVVVARVGKKIFCHIGVDDRPLTISNTGPNTPPSRRAITSTSSTGTPSFLMGRSRRPWCGRWWIIRMSWCWQG